MRKHRLLVACFALLICLSSVAYAAEQYVHFKLTFEDYDEYDNIISDTCSRDMPTADGRDSHATLFVTSNTASKNCVFKAYRGGYVTREYYYKTVNELWMIYNTDIYEGDRVYLRGRTDSDETSVVYISGQFGAG